MPYEKRLQDFWDKLPENEKKEIKQESEALKAEYASLRKTIFLSGSRSLSRLNEAIKQRLHNMIDNGFRIIIGDASGADKAFQSYFLEKGYKDVSVYHSGAVCRHNLGTWATRSIAASNNLKGRDFYTVKDKAMAHDASYGFVLWDGQSVGSMNNVFEMVKQQKPVVMYLSPIQSFIDIRTVSEAEMLLEKSKSGDIQAMSDMSSVITAQQMTFSFDMVS